MLSKKIFRKILELYAEEELVYWKIFYYILFNLELKLCIESWKLIKMDIF